MFLSTVVTFPVRGNPLPADDEWKGLGGGNPVPEENPGSVFLQREFVKALIRGDTAEMSCSYTLKNPGNSTTDLNIALPFVDRPYGVRLRIDGERTPFENYYYLYDPIDEHSDYNYKDGLESIRFSTSIGPDEEKVIKVDYETPISVYESIKFSGGGDKYYWYRYLVGTGCEWDHPIEEAKFEVRIPSKMYSEHDSEGWDRHRTITKVVFEKDYQNWFPDEDLIILRWTKTDLIPGDGKFEQTLFFGLIGSEIMVIITVVRITRKKQRKKLAEK